MDDYLRKLAEGPLADPLKINLPMGRKPPARSGGTKGEALAPGELTSKQLKDRRANEAKAKLAKLLDYYATTDLQAEAVARHCGMFRTEEAGTDEETGKPILRRVLDVEGAAEELRWRRATK